MFWGQNFDFKFFLHCRVRTKKLLDKKGFFFFSIWEDFFLNQKLVFRAKSFLHSTLFLMYLGLIIIMNLYSTQLNSKTVGMILKENTRYDNKTIREWFKLFKRECPSDRMTQEKFIEMYKRFFPGGNAEQFCNHVFKTFDSGDTGYLDFKNFILAFDMTNAGTAEEKLKVAFKMYDLDGNGELDLQEMIKIVEDIYTMQRVYSKLGANIEKPTQTAEEMALDIFTQIDENGDGSLTEEEFLTGCLQDDKLFKMLVPNVFQ